MERTSEFIDALRGRRKEARKEAAVLHKQVFTTGEDRRPDLEGEWIAAEFHLATINAALKAAEEEWDQYYLRACHRR